MTESTDSQAIIDAAQAALRPIGLDTDVLYSVCVPEGARRELLDLERFLPAPNRTRGRVTHFTGASFSAYVKVHQHTGTSLYADDRTPAIVAVLNGASTDWRGWGDHVASLSLRPSLEWMHWSKRSGIMDSQSSFAEHLEEGLAEIIEPPAIDMLEMAQSFQASVKVAFKEARQIANGQRQLVYEETISARAGEKGSITIPREFRLALRPFDGCDPYKVLARLRYRISDGRLSIGYTLDRPEEVVRAAFADVVTAVEAATGLTCYTGLPPA